MNIVFLRVSKEDEKKQDPEQQLKKIIEKYKLKDYKVVMERGSAWDLKKINKRHEFIKILKVCFDADKFTIEDLYLQKAYAKDINYL